MPASRLSLLLLCATATLSSCQRRAMPATDRVERAIPSPAVHDAPMVLTATAYYIAPPPQSPPLLAMPSPLPPKAVRKRHRSTIELQIAKTRKGQRLRIKNLNFVGGQAALLPASLPTLAALLRTMKSNARLKIRIEGHICCHAQDDKGISAARAKFVYDFLRKGGIRPRRMSHKGLGGSKPLFPLPEENGAKQVANRRVEIKIIAK